ncbi:MAG TPA: hypothetical protein VI670_01775 [Thermoanaerobaculia bacterium]|jgi:hypothetical protein
MTTEQDPAPRTSGIISPSGTASTLARRIVGFGVWFAIGCAPFLGKVRVPGFTAVIEMYPVAMQSWLIPLSGLLMGMLAVIVDYAVERRKTTKAFERRVHRWFVSTVIVFVTAFIALIGVYIFTVTHIEAVGQRVVTGTTVVPPQRPGSECECSPGQDAARCIADITLDPANIRTCFGANRVALATLALALLYLTVTGAFAAAVGIQLVGQRERKR